jgi:hypothetical protein
VGSAKRSVVGISVTVGRAVGVSGGMIGVGEAIRFVRLGNPPEQLERNDPIKIKRISFFM